MKKYISIILLVLFAVVGSAAQNKVSISSGQGVPGDIITVDVSLQNSDEVTAVEVVIPLVDKQLTYIDGSCAINSERINGHQHNVAVGGGALRIFIYSLEQKTLNGNNGIIASFNLKLGKAPAEYPLQPQAVLSDVAGNELPVIVDNGILKIVAPQVEVVTQSVDFGHIPIRSQHSKSITLRKSGTSTLNVTGLQFSAPEFTATETSFTVEPGKTKSVVVNYTPTVRGAVEESVTVISDAINGNAAIKLIADPYSVNELHCSRVEGALGEEVTVELRMNNMEPIVGLQTTFTLPDGIEYVDGSFAPTERAVSHTATASVNSNSLVLFLYSFGNSVMDGNDGVVATFRLRLKCNSGNYYIVPQNTVLSNVTEEDMTSAVSGNYIVVKSPNISGNSELDFGETPVTEVAKANYSVRNNGRATLVISSVAFLAEGYRVANELPLSIEPGAISVLNVEYLPTKEGEHSTTMNIYSNDPDEGMKPVKIGGTVYEPNNLTFEGENLQNGDYVVSIGLDNYTDIVAVQMDIHWMAGMKTSGDKLAISSRLSSHSCSVSKIADDTYRFIAFTFGNTSISGNSGKLFDLVFTPDDGVEYRDSRITVDNVVLSDASAMDYTSQLALNVLAEYSHYYVRFMCEGELVSEMFQRAGTTIVQPQMPEKNGFTFSWGEVPEVSPANDVVYTGEYKGNKYKVDYIVDGEIFATDSIAYGSEIILIEEPTKEGYTFSGWSEAPATMPASDVTIEGSFTVNYYALTYMVDGEVYATDSIAYGNEITLRDEPTKEGHTFSGWKGEKVDGYVARPIDLASNADDMLYSNAYCTMPGDEFIGWHVLFDNDPSTFFHSEWGSTNSSDGLEHYLRIDLGEGNEIENFSFTYTNRMYINYGAPKTIIVEGSDIADGPYTEIATLTDLQDKAGEVYNSPIIGNGNKYRFIRFRVTETQGNQQYSNHPFFYISEFGMTEHLYEIPISETMPARDITVTGTFAVNTYKITYMVDGEVYATVDVKYGETITTIEEPTKEGFIFSGWNGIPATMPAKDIIVTGIFGTAQSYNITYIVDGEVYATGKIVYGEKIELIEEPTKEGYTFSGWSEAPATMPASDVTIEGSFTVNYYTVTYLVDGEVYATDSIAYGSELVLRDEPTKEGYTFSGWSEAPATMPASDITIEGSFAVNYYTVTYIVDGEIFATDSIAYGSELVLRDEPTKEGHTFSGWSEAPATMPASDITIEGSFAVNFYTVTYLVDGEVYATENVAYGSEITLIDEPTKEGYTFSGWSEAPATMPAEDIVIEGSFTPITKINGVEYNKDVIIYNIRGERIVDVDNLERGVYIIDGKKVFVK